MPTKAASYAPAPRIRPGGAASAASASSVSGGSVPLIEMRLQDDLRSDLIADRTGLASTARRVEPVLRYLRRPPLVDHRDRNLEARPELVREPPRTRRHRVWRSVGVHRQADDKPLRPPLLDQRGDRLPRRPGIDRRQRRRDAGERIADRDADSACAEIEREQGRVRDWSHTEAVSET